MGATSGKPDLSTTPSTPASWRLDEVPTSALAERIGRSLGAEVGAARPVRRAFLDSFDWRLWRAGEVLIEALPAELGEEGVREIRWTRLDGGEICSVLLDRRLRTAADLPVSGAREVLARRLGERALMPRVALTGQAFGLTVTDDEGAIVLQGEIAALVASALDPAEAVEGSAAALPPRLSLRAAPGHEHRAREAARALGELAPARAPLLVEALEALGRGPGEVPGQAAALRPDDRAAHAVREVLRGIFATVEANEPGVRADIDPEFLHDLRVAVRRTRSVLGQLERALPAEEVARFSEGFRWVGTITTPTRDLDVFLHDLPGLRAELPPEQADRLDPLHDLVVERRRSAFEEMRRALQSPEYRRLVSDWRELLGAETGGKLAAEPIATVVAPRIRKLAERLARRGAAIDETTPAATLHELRKTAKKLRYLTEFFGGLFGPERDKRCLAPLKELQNRLGAFNDLDVQAERLGRYASALMGRPGVEAGHLMAIGVLIDRLRQRQAHDRAAIAEGFDAEGLRQRYAELLEGV